MFLFDGMSLSQENSSETFSTYLNRAFSRSSLSIFRNQRSDPKWKSSSGKCSSVASFEVTNHLHYEEFLKFEQCTTHRQVRMQVTASMGVTISWLFAYPWMIYIIFALYVMQFVAGVWEIRSGLPNSVTASNIILFKMYVHSFPSAPVDLAVPMNPNISHFGEISAWISTSMIALCAFLYFILLVQSWGSFRPPFSPTGKVLDNFSFALIVLAGLVPCFWIFFVYDQSFKQESTIVLFTMIIYITLRGHDNSFPSISLALF